MCIYVWECEGHVYVYMGTQRGKRTVSWSSHCPTALGTELGCWNASVPMGFRPLDELTFCGCCDESPQISWLTKTTNASCHRLPTGQMSDTSVPAIKSGSVRLQSFGDTGKENLSLPFALSGRCQHFLASHAFVLLYVYQLPHISALPLRHRIVGEGSLFERLWISWTLLQGFSF